MSQTTLLVVVVLAVIVLVAIVIAVSRSRRSKLRPLSDESKRHYAGVWRAVEARFIEEPTAAIEEAEQQAIAMLQERGAKLHNERHVPNELRRARESTRAKEGENGTEGMRQAMLHYKAVFIDAVGKPVSDKTDNRRREVA